MFERFTREAREAVERASEEAVTLGHGFVGTEHILLALTDAGHAASRILAAFDVDRRALLDEYRGPLYHCAFQAGLRPDPEALASLGIDLDQVRRRVEEEFGPGALEGTSAWGRRQSPRFTPRAKRALELALREAVLLGDRRLHAEHLLLGLAAVEDGLAARLLARRGARLAQLRASVAEEHRRPA